MKLSFRRVFYISIFIFLVLFLLGGFLMLNRTVSPLTEAEKNKVLEKLSGGQLSLTKKINTEKSTAYNGRYYTFLYPSNGVIYDSNNKKDPHPEIMENFSFEIKDFPKVYFYSEVKQAPWYLKSIADYSGVSFRMSNPNEYSKKIITVDNQQGLIFEKNILQDSESYEKIGYFLAKGRIYSFSVQSVDQQAEIGLFNKLMTTVKFLN